MPADSSRAVFLSYASQDAEAARRICEALRTAGVEVWFDQSELRGGDAWDAKIRKQIKECALFVPVISANTQARREGYFRIEWKLAAQRTHAIAEGTPFLLPVVLDAISDSQALVPAEFREVQWTALADDAAIARICARVKQLAEEPAAETGTLRGADKVSQPGAAATGSRSRRAIIIGVLGVLVSGCIFAGARIWWRQQAKAEETRVARSTTRTAELAQRLSITSRDELDVAVERARREAEAAPDSPAAWSKRARLESQYLVRGWDPSEQQRQAIQAHANRALTLDASSVDAMYALAIVLLKQGAYSQTEALLRKAMASAPSDAELRQALGSALSGQGRHVEALEIRQETLRLFPNNPFAHYDLALSFEQASPPDLESALRKFEDSIALQPFPGTVLHKVSLLAGWKGDLPGAQQLLNSLDPLERTGDRAVGIAMTIALLQHQPERAIEAAGLTARTYFEDDYVRGAKAWLLAHAYTQAGKNHLALAQWREAEAVLRLRVRATTESWYDQAGLAITLAWLDRQAEAAALMAPLEAVAREAGKPLQQLYLAYYHAGCDDAAKAAHYLKLVLERRELVTARTLPLDPWWEKIRSKAEFKALLDRGNSSTQGPAPTPASAPDAKSIAVLAFRQLSADPENEYLCEAISDELCNVLGRVPGLKVAASASAFTFKGGKRARPAEMARQLGVAYLVDGSVQKIGNRVRVRAELIKAADESIAWKSDLPDYEVKDMFAVQDEVVAAIAKNLQLQLGTAKPAVVVIDPEAYRLYYEGRRAWSMRGTAEFVTKSEEFFRQAIAADAKLGRAYSGLADVLRNAWATEPNGLAYADRNSDRLRELQSLVETALRWEPESAEAYTARGGISWQTWRFPEAERDLRTAIRLNPNYADAHLALGRLLSADGRLDEALAELKLASELDPLTSRIFDNYGGALREAGRYAEALVQAERAVALQPDSPQALRTKMNVLSNLGRHDEAIAMARNLASREAESRSVVVFVRAGQKEEAARLYAAARTSRRSTTTPLAALGRYEEALNSLRPEEAVVTAITGLYYYDTIDPLRNDPRFVNYLTTLGIKEAHDRAQAWRAAHPPEKPVTKK